MPWDQTDLFVGILSEFADAQAPYHDVEFERAAYWEHSFRVAHVREARHCAAWRRRNPGKVKAYGAEYRALHGEANRARVRSWKQRNPDKVRAERLRNAASARVRKQRWLAKQVAT